MHIKKTAIVARRYSLAQGREHIDHATRLLVLSVFASQVSTPVPSEIATHYRGLSLINRLCASDVSAVSDGFYSDFVHISDRSFRFYRYLMYM